MNFGANDDISAKDSWGWRKNDEGGTSRFLPSWARPFVVSAPWISLALVLIGFLLANGRIADARGLSVALPVATSFAEVDPPGLTAVIMPISRETFSGEETVVFFDDTRYELADPASQERLSLHLAERVAADPAVRMLVFADARISSGQLMRFVSLVRKAGVAHIQIAERRP